MSTMPALAARSHSQEAASHHRVRYGQQLQPGTPAYRDRFATTADFLSRLWRSEHVVLSDEMGIRCGHSSPMTTNYAECNFMGGYIAPSGQSAEVLEGRMPRNILLGFRGDGNGFDVVCLKEREAEIKSKIEAFLSGQGASMAALKAGLSQVPVVGHLFGRGTIPPKRLKPSDIKGGHDYQVTQRQSAPQLTNEGDRASLLLTA